MRRIALVAILLLVGFVSVVAGFSIFQHKSPMAVLGEIAGVKTPQEVFGKNNLLVLVVGLDYDYTANDIETSATSRTDVIKAINLDFGQKRAYVLSILRDTVATMPSGRQAKVNEAYSEGGIKESKAVIADFLGTPPFDRYVILRSDSVKDIIDAIGGVDVIVKDSDCLKNKQCKNQEPLNYDDNWGHLHIHLKPGLQHLDGEQAVGYSRFRHDWCSDPCRSMRQDQVLQAIVTKARGDKLNTLMHLGDLIAFVRKNVTTNLSQNEMLALATYFSDIDKDGVKQDRLEMADNVTLADGGTAITVDPAEKAKKVHDMLIAPPMPETTPDSMALLSIPPNTIKIDVQNGSGIVGAARQVALALKAKGFLIGTVGNAPTTVDESEIREHSKVTFAGVRVRVALPPAMHSLAVLSESDPTAPDSASDVTIVVGKDLAVAEAALSIPGAALPTSKP
ncbi:MAG: LCP family protein [Candidatus Eremiobacteraeota bacterium]|nr:LCP family protein [Candidatus Eremiobacteraeota bacterium]